MNDFSEKNVLEKFYLSNVCYKDSAKSVCAEFSNLNNKITKCFAFFPSFHPWGIGIERLAQSLSSFPSNSFKLVEENDVIKNNTVKIVANKFSTLKEIHSFLKEEFAKDTTDNKNNYDNKNNDADKEFSLLSPLLPPERQFLILNNFSYFDSFTFQNEELFPLNDFSFPKTVADFSPEPLHEIFSQLNEFDKTAAKKFLDTLTVSNILKTHFTQTPLNLSIQFECFLENLFFKHTISMNSDAMKTISFNKNFNNFRRNFSDTIELDFSHVFSQMLLEKNICFNSINCDCCEPNAFSDSSVLPSSLVKVRFLEEAFYFDSQFAWFAEKFHLLHENKQLRLRRKKEFFLQNFPVGPFFSGEEEFIPLIDALQLRENNSIELLSEQALQWACIKRKAPLAIELSYLLQKNAFIKENLHSVEKNLLQHHGLQAFTLMENDLDAVFRKSCSQNLLELFNFSSHYLSNASNKYFSLTLSEALLSFKALILFKLKEFASENNARFLGEQDCRVFLQELDSFNLSDFLHQKSLIQAK